MPHNRALSQPGATYRATHNRQKDYKPEMAACSITGAGESSCVRNWLKADPPLMHEAGKIS